MAVRIPLYLISHHRKIANLYKKWLRTLEGQFFDRTDYIYEAGIARAEFECIYYEKDMRKSKQMLLEKEEKLHSFPEKPKIFPTSVGGVAYERGSFYSDVYLDYWHPLEKACYPDYFARREIRKQQYVEMWEKLHGPPKPDDL